MYFKIVFFVTFLLFLYLGYLGIKEFFSFNKSEQKKSLSVFEKIVINFVFYLFAFIELFFLINYIYLIIFFDL